MTDQSSRVPRLGPDEASGGMREVFERFIRERGKIPNLFRVAAHRPSIGETLAAHMSAVMGPGTVDVRLKELLSIRVSHINRCEY
jgi:alkylhydroperoxidase family enzyme